ncbi:hypothetical protein [Candidatus Accumulibacter vicinus]|uniref:hypothetical protein n=1 Tax=Candidatus Accumulibacter vicinus TaxID=2954382 RepID=UPI0004B5D3AC|nr:hypothetical protein [Candidatus Accumulibacter vicinus]
MVEERQFVKSLDSTGGVKNRGKLIQTDILDADASQIVADLWKPRNALQEQQNVEKCGN